MDHNVNIKDIIINKEYTLLECYRLLNDTGERILVCLEDGRLMGIIMDSDLRRGILSGIKLEDKIATVINPHPVVATSDMSKNAILALMKEKSVDPVPVVDKEGNFVDLYRMNELLRSIDLPNSAVIMAGGLGRRLMPLTKDMPKPLLRIGGKPIIEHVIRHIADCRIESFYITVNYKSDMIKKYLKDGQHLGVKITYLEEKKQLGTIGAISLLKNHAIEFPFIVMNGDILTRVNFRNLLEEHKSSGNPLTVCLRMYHYDVPYGVVDVHDGKVMGVSEKPEYDFFINAGIYCMSPELIEFIPSDSYYDIDMLINSFLSKGITIGTFPIDEYWRDIGNIKDFYGAKSDFQNGNIV
ncbi:MAG: nucleotidyltransferase family protein [bacterium]